MEVKLDVQQSSITPPDPVSHYSIKKIDTLSVYIKRCICVCKSWYNLVSDPYFIRSHLILKSADEKEYLAIGFQKDIYTTDHYSFRCDDTLIEKLKVKCPISESARGSRIVGCCNGLFLMVKLDTSFSDMYLWNPSLGKIKPLSNVHATYKNEFRLEALGLAFLPEACDYKVIRILNFSSDYFSVAEIYSLRTDSWRRIETPVDRLMPIYDCPLSAAFVYPFFYWVGIEYHDYIVSFNLECETFKAMSLPDACLNDNGRLDGSLAVFQESLYLLTFRLSEGWSLWMMKENYSSGMTCLKICTIRYRLPIGFMKNGDVIMEDMKNKVSLHDPRNVSIPRNTDCEIRWGSRSSKVYNYSRVLHYLIKEMEGFSQTIP